jgi:putative aldouronate transport system permease protein
MKIVRFGKALIRDRYLVIMVLPVILYFILFAYYPMYGVLIAFKDYSISKGILGSEWAGFQYFEQFFSSLYFNRLLKNTLLISVYSLLWGFPIPIIFALMLNEFKDSLFKRGIQTIAYLPHFISLVVICGMLINFLSPQGGIINQFITLTGNKPINFLGTPKWFRTVYIASGIWQEFGWSSIIYLAALSGINPELYESARIDGAGRWKQMLHITLPGIKPTILTILILSIGNIMSVGYEKIILIYNQSTYETADVISSYVYRMGLLSQQYSYAGAVGLFNSAVNVALLLLCNVLGKRFFGVGIW